MSAMPSTRRALVAVLTVVALIVGACGDDGDDPAGDDADDPAAAAAAALDRDGDDSDSDDADGDAEPEQLDPTAIPGEIVDKYSLDIDDCFDQLEDLRAGRPVTITTRLSCDEPHHYQVYARLSYPAPHPSTFPGDEVMADYALGECYLAFPAWVGTTYEISELDIGVIVPTLDNFENSQARYRGVHCYVEHVEGEVLLGTMRGTGR